jgi:hypothetical protein
VSISFVTGKRCVPLTQLVREATFSVSTCFRVDTIVTVTVHGKGDKIVTREGLAARSSHGNDLARLILLFFRIITYRAVVILVFFFAS